MPTTTALKTRRPQARPEVRIIVEVHIDHPEVLQSARKANHYSIRDLAAEVARRTKRPCSPSLIQWLCSGKRSNVDADRAKAIIDILRMDQPVAALVFPVTYHVSGDTEEGRAA